MRSVWQSVGAQETATIDLVLPTPQFLHSFSIGTSKVMIDVLGNAGSAFVEIQAAEEDERYKTLLPTTMLQAPLDARNGFRGQRIRSFGQF